MRNKLLILMTGIAEGCLVLSEQTSIRELRALAEVMPEEEQDRITSLVAEARIDRMGGPAWVK